MNREVREEEFIKKLAAIAKSNPDLLINTDLVYGNLVRIGVNNIETRALEPLFDGWINHFKDIPNIKVFVSKNWKYFCQFVNTDITDFNSQVKMYIPLDKEHIARGATELFEFMARHRIKHSSKIGQDERNDDVVIRVYNLEDAKKIQKYVERNEYIKKGMIQLNPFSIENNGIAYAVDGMLSYNTEVAEHIVSYIKKLKENQALDEAGIKGFREFLEKEYYDTFKSGKNLVSFIHDRGIKGSREYVVDELINHMEVAKLIYISSQSQAKLDDLIEHRKSINILANKEQAQDQMGKLLDEQIRKTGSTDIIVKSQSQVLEASVIETFLKYGIAQTSGAIMQYIKTENARGFTRTNNARDDVKNNIKPSEMEQLVTNRETNSVDAHGYVSLVAKRYMDELKIKKEIFDEATYITFAKYGYENTAVAILEYAKHNRANGFTRTYDARQRVLNNVTPIDATRIITNYQTHEIDINNYITEVVQAKENSKAFNK